MSILFVSLELIFQSISGFRGGCVQGVAVGVGWRKGRVEDVEDAGAEKEVEDEKAGGREERKRVCIHNE